MNNNVTFYQILHVLQFTCFTLNSAVFKQSYWSAFITTHHHTAYSEPLSIDCRHQPPWPISYSWFSFIFKNQARTCPPHPVELNQIHETGMILYHCPDLQGIVTIVTQRENRPHLKLQTLWPISNSWFS